MPTTSRVDVSVLVLLSGALPVVIRTSWTSVVVLTPRNDRLREAVGHLGTGAIAGGAHHLDPAGTFRYDVEDLRAAESYSGDFLTDPPEGCLGRAVPRRAAAALGSEDRRCGSTTSWCGCWRAEVGAAPAPALHTPIARSPPCG